MKNISRHLVCWGAAFLLLTGALFVLPPGAVWITDNGNKYMMMRNFANGEGLRIPHPEASLFPTGGFHFIPVQDGVCSFYPEYLSFFTSFSYKLAGERGTLFFPLAATLLLLFLAWRCWHIPPVLLLLSTPLFFYSLLLWEMTPSVFLVTVSLLLAERKKFTAAGAVLGISLLMREEAYFIFAALCGAFLFTRNFKALLKFAGGFLCAALPIWLYQWSFHGHILGTHGKNYYVNNNANFTIFSQCKAAFFNCFHHLIRFDGWESSLCNMFAWSVLFPLAAGAAPRFKAWKNLKYGACAIYLGAMFFLCAGLFFHKNTIYAASMLTGFLTAAPVILGFTVNWRAFVRCRKFRLMALATLLYTIAVPFLMTASDVGLVWGARHFLILLPLLVHLSFCGFRLMGIPRVTFSSFRKEQLIPLAALLLSVFIQLFGLFALHRVSGESFRIEQKLLAAPEKIIVTDLFYLPEQMPRLFFEKTILQVTGAKDLDTLSRWLQKQKHRSFLLIISPQFRRMNDTVLKSLLERYPLTAPPEKMTGKGGFPDFFAGKCRVQNSR
ncbi:MAG: hypothetical protein IKD44_03895 [Lentisphaeria bacterium]|nr:hypothetical protein [Lentisphaeria bacterium]